MAVAGGGRAVAAAGRPQGRGRGNEGLCRRSEDESFGHVDGKLGNAVSASSIWAKLMQNEGCQHWKQLERDRGAGRLPVIGGSVLYRRGVARCRELP